MEKYRLAKKKALKGYFIVLYICTVFFVGLAILPLFMRETFKIDETSIGYIIMYEAIFGVAALFCLFGIVFSRLRVTTSLGEKMITSYLEEHGNTLELQARIEKFFETRQVLSRLWLDSEFIAGMYNTKTIFGSVKDVVWIYRKDLNQTTGYAIGDAALEMSKAEPTTCVKIYFKNKKSYNLQMDSGEDADKVVECFKRNCPWVVTEETQEMHKKYRKKEYPFFN